MIKNIFKILYYFIFSKLNPTPFFRPKSQIDENLPPEEKLKQARKITNGYLHRDRAEFDKKNVDFSRVPADTVVKIRHETDEHIKRSRDYIAQNVDIELHHEAELATVITIIGNENRALNAARTKSDLQKSAGRVAAIEATRIVMKASYRYDMVLINTHNRDILNEVIDDIRGIKRDFIAENRRISAEYRSKRLDECSFLESEETDVLSNDDTSNQTNPEFSFSLSELSLLTLENFDQIQNGMNLSEVFDILGSTENNKLFNSNSDVGFYKWTIDDEIETYTWIASRPPKPSERVKIVGLLETIACSVSFCDGVAVGKAHEALKSQSHEQYHRL